VQQELTQVGYGGARVQVQQRPLIVAVAVAAVQAQEMAATVVAVKRNSVV
jgi:hypothetical protein